MVFTSVASWVSLYIALWVSPSHFVELRVQIIVVEGLELRMMGSISGNYLSK